MATVDMNVDIVIHRPRGVVAAYATDPDNSTELVRQHQERAVEDAASDCARVRSSHSPPRFWAGR